jgi:hypothetical protein
MSQVQTEEQPTGPVTQVTSLAQEEQRTGVKANVPSAEELVTRASSSIIVNSKRLNDLIEGKGSSQKYKISRGGMNRVLLAILNLPTEGLPVNLKTNEEKLAFAIGQRLISDRFVLTQYHISEEYRKQREAREKTEATQTQGEQNVTGQT